MKVTQDSRATHMVIITNSFTKRGVLLRVEIPKLISTMRFTILYLKYKANEIS
jgi:hypothetical protein